MAVDVEVSVVPPPVGPFVTRERTEHGASVIEGADGQKYARLQFDQLLDTLSPAGEAGTEERTFVTMLNVADIDQLMTALGRCRDEMVPRVPERTRSGYL